MEPLLRESLRAEKNSEQMLAHVDLDGDSDTIRVRNIKHDPASDYLSRGELTAVHHAYTYLCSVVRLSKANLRVCFTCLEPMLWPPPRTCLRLMVESVATNRAQLRSLAK